MKRTSCLSLGLLFYLLTSFDCAAIDYLAAATDYDGDGLGDVAVYEPTTKVVTIRGSSNKKYIQKEIGTTGSIFVPGDYNGDGRGDLVTYQKSTGVWSYKNLVSGIAFDLQFGGVNYLPVPGRYNRHVCPDFAVYNIKTGILLVRDCYTGNIVSRATMSKQMPIPADYDGDGVTDFALFNRTNNKWTVYGSSMGTKQFTFGKKGDLPFPVDFNNEGRANVAVYRNAGNNFVVGKRNVFSGKVKVNHFKQWGLYGDKPMALSIDADGRAEYAVYRPSDNAVYITTSQKKFYKYSFGERVAQSAATADDDDTDYDSEEGIVKYYAEALCVRGNLETRNNFVRRCITLVTAELNDDYSYGDNYDFSATLIQDTINALYPADSLGLAKSWVKKAPGVLQSSVFDPTTATTALYVRNFNDYDRDGLSNLIMVGVKSDQTYLFNVAHDSARYSSFIFGNSKQDVVFGDYDGDGKANPVVVRTSRTKAKEIEWIQLDGLGTLRSLHWGRVGDRPVAGDFDGDGRYDPAVTRINDKKLVWFIYLSTGEKIQNLNFGNKADYPFAADINGDGIDEIIVAKKVQNNIYWYYRAVKNNKETEKVSWGINGDRILRPYDANGDGRADLIVARNVGTIKQFYIKFTGTKDSKTVSFGASTDYALAGHYTSSTSADVAVYRQSSAMLYATNILTGSVIGISTAGKSGFPLPSDGVRNINSTIGKSFDGVQCDVTSDFYDGSGGALWKPVSESHGNAIFLLPAKYGSVRKAEVLSSQGQLLTTAKFRKYFGNGRPVMDTPMRASAMAAYAPITVRFVHNGVNVCYVTNNPTARND